MDSQPTSYQVDMARKFKERLGLGKDYIGIHAYNWDLLGRLSQYDNETLQGVGPLPCENKTSVTGKISPCGFDTHYPEFFPEKRGLDKLVKGYQDLGMRVVPYTNGHLFDPVTVDWVPELAQKASVKLNRRYHFRNYLDEHPDFAKAPPILNITQ